MTTRDLTFPEALTPFLPFAEKYDAIHAHRYFHRHHTSPLRRLSNRREIDIARRALRLAGHPQMVLDIPCGTGRFWSMLAEHPQRVILAADLNSPMIETGLRLRDPELVSRIRTFQASAFEIPCPDNDVDAILCMRLLHHIPKEEHRQQLLRELHRVTGHALIASLWIDGNYGAWRWRVKERQRPHVNRFLVPRRQIEEEFQSAGFRILGRFHLLRFYSMWATYVLVKT